MELKNLQLMKSTKGKGTFKINCGTTLLLGINSFQKGMVFNVKLLVQQLGKKIGCIILSCSSHSNTAMQMHSTFFCFLVQLPKISLIYNPLNFLELFNGYMAISNPKLTLFFNIFSCLSHLLC